MNGGFQTIIDQLIDHEGLKLKVYNDVDGKPVKSARGKLSIGVGRNLEDRGLTREEAIYLLTNDIYDVLDSLKINIPLIYNKMDSVRKAVLVDMCFNLGLRGLLRFKKMLKALINEDYEEAARQMEDSNWFRQVKRRGVILRDMMLRGERRGIDR